MSVDTLEAVDAQLAAAEAKLLALRREKNSMSPTHHLPPEVLLRILCYASDDILDGYRRKLWVTRLPSWVTVTQVCHQWREITLSAPTYWADIALHTPSWMRETIARSKSALIRLNYVSSTYSKYVLEPLKHLERVSDLTLMQDNLVEWYMPILRDRPAPNLRVLRLGPQLFYTPRGTDIPLFNFSEETFFAGQIPRLQTLDLSMTILSPTSPLFAPHLRYLSYTCLPEDKRMTMGKLLEALSRMPELEHVYLHSVLPIAEWPGRFANDEDDADAGEDAAPAVSTPAAHSGDPIALPTLRNLVIYEKNVRDIITFLSNIKLSPAAAISLKSVTSRLSETAATLEPMHKHFMDAAAHHTHDFDNVREDLEPYHDLYWGGNTDDVAFTESTVITLSVVSPEADNEIAFSRKPNLDQFSPTRGKDPVHYGAQLSFSSPELSKGVDLIGHLFSRYPATPANITRLSVENIDLSEGDWHETFKSCKNVLRVTAQGGTAATLLRALMIHEGDGYSDVLFPRLQQLALARLDLVSYDPDDEESSSLFHLLCTLRKRLLHRIALGSMRIKDCDIHIDFFDEHIRPLLVFRYIVWDEQEYGLTKTHESQYEEIDEDEEDSDVNMDN